MWTGRTLGDFTLGSVLGEGGHGIVYRAEQRGLGREAVIKVLHARHDTDDGVVQRFLREARLASRLDHPFAAHVYAFGAEPDGLLWIAMELVRGTTLRDVLAVQPGRKLPLSRVVPLLDGLCEVVHTAHEQGIVHRDLKPDNIMVLSRAGRLMPKLLDLGVATLVSERGQHGAMIGSPYYMAPEQWREDGAVDARTDVYALGVLTFEALAGDVPYRGATLTELARAHVSGEVPRLPDVAPELEAAVRRALAKSPDDRFPTALAFAQAVRAAAGHRVAFDALPRLDEMLRAEIAWMPQPIADAVAALEAARNPHQARDALWAIVRIVVRWLGVVALAAQSRTGGDLGPTALALVRALHQRELTDDEWLELLAALAAPFAAIRDAHPIPELVDLALAEPSPFAPLLALRTADAAIATEESLRDHLERTLPVVAPLLRAITFLSAYHVVVPRGDRGEVWMGTRRTARPLVAVPPTLTSDEPVLSDFDGQPILQLAPLVQIARPAPGVPEEMFLVAGPARVRGHGARLVAEPHGFELHDDRVWAWLRALLPLDTGPAAPHAPDAPYRGLATFTEADADLFFGREREARAFANRLLVEPLLAVVGPSGTGKSSFVRAGVIPLLPTTWRPVVVRPGAKPLAVLGALGDRPVAGDVRVVVVDQLEELFTLCGDATERARFGEALATIASDERVRVVLTIRDDFLARTSELPGLRELLSRGVTLLATPAPEDIVRVIVEPARRAGYDIDPGIAEEMAAAVEAQPGALALVSFTALRLWELRDRHFRRLTREAYRALGGVIGAFAQHAEDTLRGCTAEEQRQVREAFRHLVTAEGTRAVISRRDLDHVLGGSGRIIDRLIAARLLVSAEGDDGTERIEVIHEALLVAWPRLAGWRREDADGARLRDQLRVAAQQWDARGQPRGLLWRDEALEDYVRWRARWAGTLPELDHAFAEASVRDAHRGRRVRRGLAGTAAALAIAAVASLSLLYRSAEHSAADARARELASYVEQGRALLAAGDYRGALAPLHRARDLGDRSRVLALMLHRTEKVADVPVLALNDVGVAAAFRRDGDLAFVDHAGNAGIWSVATRAVRARLGPPASRPNNFGPAVSADGVHVAIPHPDAVVVWDGVQAIDLAVARAERVAFDARGERLAVATSAELSVWELATARRLWSVALPKRAGRIAWTGDAVVTQDGALATAWRHAQDGTRALGSCERLATAADGSFACLAATGVTVFGPDAAPRRSFAAGGVDRIALSSDGVRIALARASGVIDIDDVATGAQRGVIPARAAQLVFTLDGEHLVAADASTVSVWDLDAMHEVMRYSSIGGSATILAGAPYLVLDPQGQRVALVGAADIRAVSLADPAALVVIDAGEAIGYGQWLGAQIVTTSETGVEVWDGATGARRVRLAAPVKDNAHPSPDGTLVAIPLDGSRSVEVRELASGAVRAKLVADADVRCAAFDPTGAHIVVGTQRGDLEIFDLAGRVVQRLPGHTGIIFRVAFSADGSRIVSASADSTARIWDVASGRELGRITHDDDVYDAELDPAGRYLVTACHDRSVGLWDARTFARLATFQLATPANAAAFDASAEFVAVGGEDGTVAVFDVASRRELLRFHHAAAVEAVAFGPRGLLATSLDHTAVVWDVADGTSVAPPTSGVTRRDSP